MTIGIILIVAILVLGGVLATAGDRIGTKVGKARLSLFNLRPKKTATLITIVTGISISASTLGILFATSKPLRKGIFEYDQIQEKIREIRRELDKTIVERDRVQLELNQARTQQTEAQKRLNATNQSLQFALGKLNKAVSDLELRENQLKQSQLQLSQTQSQKTALQTEIQQRKAESQALLQQLQQGRLQIEQQNQNIQRKTDEIEQKNQNIQEKNQVIDLKNQQIEQANQTIQEKNEDIEKTNQLLADKNREINQKNDLLTQRNQEIEDKNKVIEQQEDRLQGLENQQAFLEQEVQSLERNFQELQVGTIVLRRGQVLTSQVLQILNSQLATSTIEDLLNQANQEALKITQPGTNNSNEQVIQITQAQLQEVINEISNGEEYVVRIISAANYVLGEKQVQVFIDAARNRVVFQPGDVVAATSVDPKRMSAEQVRDRLELLLAASSFRARRVGILNETTPIIADGSIQPLIQFLSQLRQQTQSVDIKAVASTSTYTAGPLVIELVAVRNGQVLFQTCSPNAQIPGCQ